MLKMVQKIEACDGLSAEANHGEKFLIFGKTGWIGGMLGKLLQENGRDFVFAEARMEDRRAVKDELEKVKPTHVLNAAGKTGRPNVDWCEDHQIETIRANVLGTMTLCDVCHELNIHCTIFATGCIFSYDEEHPMGGRGFTEEDHPNFKGSFYSFTKGMVEEMLRSYSNTCVLRVRMPISDDLSPRNFLTKISKYEKVVNIPNSMTILTDLLPVAIVLALRRKEGIFNFTNPGAISHNECLELYKKYIDSSFTWQNFTEQDQAKVLKAARSNNELDSSKLERAVPDISIPHIKDSIHNVYKRMKVNLAGPQE